jgi:hypothetical protein
MFKKAIHSKAGVRPRRRHFAWLAVCALGTAALTPAAADTYLSRWNNATTCTFLVKGNGEAKLITESSTYDFGPFPMKDPQGIVVEPAGSCDLKLKRATIDWRSDMGNDPFWKCPGLDHGPYRFIVNSGNGDQHFCYCVKTLRVAYLGVAIAADAVTLQYSDSAYKCQHR